MSIFDVLTHARGWIAANDEVDAARAEIQKKGPPYAEGCFDRMKDAERRARESHLALLAAARDLPNDGAPDEPRVARLRVENERLHEQTDELRRQLDNARRNNEERNRELDALHYVWCNGGCTTGVHRYEGSPESVTEEVVALAERNTRRLRTWFENFKLKKSYAKNART